MLSSTKIQSFTGLTAWKQGHVLALSVYKITASFPHTETYSLVDQMRRCAISITSNIAEGFSRRIRQDKLHFYSIALGSITELQNQLVLSRDLGYVSSPMFRELADQTVLVHKLINGFSKSAVTRR